MTSTEGRQLRDEGVHANLAAATATNRSFRDHAEAIISCFIRQQQDFTADDIRRHIPDDIQPHSPNVLPSVLSHLSAQKLIRPIGWTASGRPSRHHSVIRVWRGNTNRG